MEESRKKANKKWLKQNYESITIRVPKGTKEKIKTWAEDTGMSMAAYIQQACKEKAEKFEKALDILYYMQYNIIRKRDKEVPGSRKEKKR